MILFFCRLDVFIFHVRAVFQRRYSRYGEGTGHTELVTKIHVVYDWNEHVQKNCFSSAQLNRCLCFISSRNSYEQRVPDDSVCIFNSSASISFVCSYIAQQQHTSSSLMRAILGMLVRSWCRNEVIQNIVLKMWGLIAVHCFPNA